MTGRLTDDYDDQCWENKVYPRGWNEADELTQPPSDSPLFDGVDA